MATAAKQLGPYLANLSLGTVRFSKSILAMPPRLVPSAVNFDSVSDIALRKPRPSGSMAQRATVIRPTWANWPTHRKGNQ